MMENDLLKEELKRADGFKNENLKKYENNRDLYKLSPDNVSFIEAMLLCNPRYSNFDYVEIKDLPKLDEFKDAVKKNKSSTYLIKLIKAGKGDIDINNNIFNENYTYKSNDNREWNGNLIFHILRKINQENSARVSKNDIEAMADVINNCKKINNDINKLFEILKAKDEKGDHSEGYNFIQKLTVIKNHNKNISLATKFCHYMCINYFDDENRDNYSIYDNVVANAIPKYFDAFKESEFLNDEFKGETKNTITKYTDKSNVKNNKYDKFYSDYQKLIDSIRKAASKSEEPEISRNGFDHILWYTNK